MSHGKSCGDHRFLQRPRRVSSGHSGLGICLHLLQALEVVTDDPCEKARCLTHGAFQPECILKRDQACVGINLTDHSDGVCCGSADDD